MFLLAVDLGVRTGLALYGRDGRLVWYRSKNFGSAARLKRGVKAVLDEITGLERLIIEGGGDLAEIWESEAEWRGIKLRQISAADWRSQFLHPREQRSGSQAKRVADELARRVINWSKAARPTSLRHDAAEAILVGLWGVVEVGWLAQLPAELRR
ncbi:MAG: hypothetical protein KDJ65_33525 [Anaerolineae bacterium]|nr:hypothetical protein [Anaerolineae bacterium]